MGNACIFESLYKTCTRACSECGLSQSWAILFWLVISFGFVLSLKLQKFTDRERFRIWSSELVTEERSHWEKQRRWRDTMYTYIHIYKLWSRFASACAARAFGATSDGDSALRASMGSALRASDDSISNSLREKKSPDRDSHPSERAFGMASAQHRQDIGKTSERDSALCGSDSTENSLRENNIPSGPIFITCCRIGKT